MKKVKKEHKEKIMEMIKKGENNEYETSWNEKGIPISKKKSNIKKGKLSRAAGARFELKARGELEKEGWVIDKWTNNVNLEEGKVVKAKRKYNPFKKVMVIGTGFPDFVAFKKSRGDYYEVIGVESKMNGTLSKIEKEKCAWYLKNEIFSRILIAKKSKERGKVDFVDFKKKHGKNYKV